MSSQPRRKRIALVIGTANRGGAEGQLVRLATELQGRGHDVRVLFLAIGGPLTLELDGAGVKWQVCRPVGLPTSTGRNLVALLRMAYCLARFRPETVYAWLAGVIWCALPIAAIVTRAQRIAAFRGQVVDFHSPLLRRLFRWAVSRADAVTINAPALQEEALQWGARPERIVLLPNGVELPDWRACVDVQPPTAVVVANFRWYKGHEVLIEALTHVSADLKVRLLGDGSARAEIASMADRLGVADKVVFVGHPANVDRELAAAQFGIHPSHTEGLSNAILEELAAGLPVVATDVGGTPLLVQNGVNGFLVPAADAQALAERITEMATSPQLRVEMAAAARAKAEEFSWKCAVDRVEELFFDAHGSGSLP
jgi:L-malate glycosyltransferase